MMMLVCMVLAMAFAVGLKKPIHKVPWLFYLLALAVDILVVFGGKLDFPQWFYASVVMANGRCLFAFGLFTVVMFIGVLKDGSRLKHWLVPIRAELSIIASILAAGHMVRYVGVYSLRAIASPASLTNGMLLSFVAAALIAVMLVLLAVTSLKPVKRRMNAKVWKSIQRLAYPFFVLIYAHVLLIMLRPLLTGATGAVANAVVYGAVVLLYVVLRLRRYAEDRAARVVLASATAEASKDSVVAEA